MKSFFAAAACVASLAAHGQAPPKGCDSPESRQMDFWIGEWDAEYVQGGVKARSRNRITKVLDGCAIFEEFTGAPGIALDGRSYSVFDRATNRWKQTWVDNSGAYLDFVGGEVDGNRVFAREFQRQGKALRQRMVFKNVTREAFKWLWQLSDDDGNTWKTMWEIDYRRVK